MSTMKHDGKAKQQSLELPDNSISEKQNEELSFVLKIHDGHLHEVSASTIINLLSAFNQILGIKDAGFKTVKEGSITLALNVPNPLVMNAIANIQKATIKNNNQISRIQKELSKYGLTNADISYGAFNNDVYQIKEVLLKVPEHESENIFNQEETLDGCITRLQKGKDKSDHITIILNNGDEVPAECSHSMLEKIHPYFNTGISLRFKGVASYLTTSNNYELKLKKYVINSFLEVENIGIDDWIDNFRSKGASGWSKFDDPITEWLKERQS